MTDETRKTNDERGTRIADVEIRILGDEVFQRTIEDLIQSSSESERAIFLSGMHQKKTAYFVICLTSPDREHVLAAQDMIEHMLCVPNPILDRPQRGHRKHHGETTAEKGPA